MELKLKLPGANEPGYLRREQERVEFYEQYVKLPRAEQIPALIDWLARFVDAEDKEAVEAVWDASEEQINELVSIFVLGNYPRTEIEPPEKDSSATG